MIEELEQVSLFQDLTPGQLNAVSQFCSYLVLADGDMLIHEADKKDHDLYLLCKGMVEIVSN